MMSSNRFGGSVTGARPRVQVGSAAGAESGTIVPAEQQVGLSGESQFLPHDHSPTSTAAARSDSEVEVGIVHRVGIGA